MTKYAGYNQDVCHFDKDISKHEKKQGLKGLASFRVLDKSVANYLIALSKQTIENTILLW